MRGMPRRHKPASAPDARTLIAKITALDQELVSAIEARDHQDLDWGVRHRSVTDKLKQACSSYWFCGQHVGCSLCTSGVDGKPPREGSACYFCPVGQCQPKTIEDKLVAIIFSPVPVMVKLKEMDPNHTGHASQLARAPISSGPFEA